MESLIQLTIGGKTARSKTGQHPVEIDWDKLPDASQDFIRRYGLKQYLADGMAGAVNVDEAKAGVEARVAKLLSGDPSRRSSGEREAGPDTPEGRAFKNAKLAVRKAATEQNVKVTKEQVSAAAKAWVDANPKWLAEAKKQLEAERKAAEAIGEDEAADILKSLGITPADEVKADTE